jgi:HrpA-like RNA helicase
MIGITQPRRVAAVSMALRVEKELNVENKGIVAYQVPNSPFFTLSPQKFPI